MRLKQIYENIIKEDVYGRLATVYHRTNSLDNIKSIVEKGFDPGVGKMYGSGLYCVYEFDPQDQKLNDLYGEYVIKFAVNLSKYLILEYEESKKIYGNKYKFKDQLDIFLKNGIISEGDYRRLSFFSDDVDEANDKGKFTSKIAHSMSMSHKNELHKFSGIVFHGKTDGEVLVSYDVKSLKFLAWANIDEIPIQWNKFSEFGKEVFKKELDFKKLLEEFWLKLDKNKELIEILSKKLKKRNNIDIESLRPQNIKRFVTINHLKNCISNVKLIIDIVYSGTSDYKLSMILIDLEKIISSIEDIVEHPEFDFRKFIQSFRAV